MKHYEKVVGASAVVNIRWMIKSDLDDVIAIEQNAFHDPWSKNQLIELLRRKNVIGMVAEAFEQKRIVGFMVYELQKHQIVVLNFAVDQRHRREGVGSRLFLKLMTKLTTQRPELIVRVTENNLHGQLFFRAVGMFCQDQLPEFYDDSATAYEFVYRYDWIES